MIAPLLIIMGLAGGALLLWYRSAQASIPPDDETGGALILHAATRLTGTFLGDTEDHAIFNIAQDKGIDARLLAAIRKAENGGPGREFGIVSTSAPTYLDQASIAANTIRNNVARYEAERGYTAAVNGRYTEEFIGYLSGVYAPIGAANDPTGLNVNWFRNVNNFYRSIDYA